MSSTLDTKKMKKSAFVGSAKTRMTTTTEWHNCKKPTVPPRELINERLTKGHKVCINCGEIPPPNFVWEKDRGKKKKS